MSFDILAPHYRWMELVLAGTKLQRCRTAFLNKVPAATNILLAGEGNGRFLIECRRKFPHAAITVLDSSQRMLECSRGRLDQSGLGSHNLKWIHTDILNWEPQPGRHDLIATHFFLDCFDRARLEAVVGKLSTAAARSAVWLLSDFHIPSQGFRRIRASAIHALMYHFFRFTTRLPARRLIPPDTLLEARHFVLQATKAFDWGLLHSQLWELALPAVHGEPS